MSKRSFFWALAVAGLASVVMATPSHAGSTTVTTDVTFSVSAGGTATNVEVTYAPAVDPTASLMITSTGGLSGLSISEAANQVTVDFTAAAATSGKLEWTFTTGTLPPITFSSASLTGVSSGSTGQLSVAVSASTPGVPEPTSVALLGIGMTGFLACRRLFKRAARDRAS